MKLMGIEQLVGTAMSSDSNGIAESKIKVVRQVMAPIMERNGADSWKFNATVCQGDLNSRPGESGFSPEELLFTFTPRRIQDLLHDVSTLPDSEIKRLLEDRQAMIEDQNALKAG